MKTVRSCRFNLFVSAAALALLLIINSCSEEGGSNSAPPDDIVIKSLDPKSPASLNHYKTSSSNDRVNIKYDYNITHEDGARIWVRPYTEGDPSPGYLYSPSDVFKGKGSRSVLISIDEDAGSVHVDQLKIIISDPDQTETINERFVEVDYTFE